MSPTEPLRDPLGNNVYIIPWFLTEAFRDYARLEQIIKDPAFAIRIKNEAIYFFKLVDEDVNMVIETKFFKEELIATDCIENPTVAYISNLLKKGGLVSFSEL